MSVTYEQLVALIKLADRLQWRHTATLATVVANTSGNLENPVKVEDFLPAENDEQDLSKLSLEELNAHFMKMFSTRSAVFILNTSREGTGRIG